MKRRNKQFCRLILGAKSGKSVSCALSIEKVFSRIQKHILISSSGGGDQLRGEKPEYLNKLQRNFIINSEIIFSI